MGLDFRRNNSFQSSTSSSSGTIILGSSHEVMPLPSIDDKKEKGPKRRKHKNSKIGCPNCKKRRVKCSEDLPSCLNCIKHKVKCGYLDYTPEQIDELIKAKELDEQESKSSKPNTEPSSSSSAPTSRPHHAKSVASVQSRSSNSSGGTEYQLFNQPLPPQQPPPTMLNDFSHLNPQLSHLNFNDDYVFQNSITQDFHSLLSNNESQIIYPVYSINNEWTNNVNSALPGNFYNNQWSNETTNSLAYPFNLESNPQLPVQYGYDNYVDSNTNLVDPSFPYKAENIQNQINSEYLPLADKFNLIQVDLSNALPGAIKSNLNFFPLARPDVNYGIELLKYLAGLGPKIAVGKASLPEIRDLYTLWLNSFIYKSYTADTMFSCLINLTTNYLVSNVLNVPHESFASLHNKTRTKNILIVHSIKHYAVVIQHIRSMLHNNEEPDLCAQVSYILSLMSIYDPEATLHSTNCFRDGLFGILSHTLNLSLKNHTAPPTIVSVHLHLMTNISRSIYLPSYSPEFLKEFNTMLISYGNLIKMIKLQIESSQQNPQDNRTLTFVENMFNALTSFINDSIQNYIPSIINNLGDMDIQQLTLFTMATRWVRLQPAKLTIMRVNSDPLEKILYLFYKAFKKAIFAVTPQIKFFFLRDFDSPLMLDVFGNYHDYDIYHHELDDPISLCVSQEIYDSIKTQLKILSSYLIRLLTFFEARLRLLYKTIVYEKATKELFPIVNIKEWRNSITNIGEVRNDFNRKIGVVENPITTFGDTLIQSRHYPRVRQTNEILVGEKIRTRHREISLEDGIDISNSPSPLPDQFVDLLTLSELGLLEKDAKPIYEP